MDSQLRTRNFHSTPTSGLFFAMEQFAVWLVVVKGTISLYTIYTSGNENSKTSLPRPKRVLDRHYNTKIYIRNHLGRQHSCLLGRCDLFVRMISSLEQRCNGIGKETLTISSPIMDQWIFSLKWKEAMMHPIIFILSVSRWFEVSNIHGTHMANKVSKKWKQNYKMREILNFQNRGKLSRSVCIWSTFLP